jgi:hypothetical protein
MSNSSKHSILTNWDFHWGKIVADTYRYALAWDSATSSVTELSNCMRMATDIGVEIDHLYICHANRLSSRGVDGRSS